MQTASGKNGTLPRTVQMYGDVGMICDQGEMMIYDAQQDTYVSAMQQPTFAHYTQLTDDSTDAQSIRTVIVSSIWDL